MVDVREPKQATEQYPTLRLMGEIDWTESEDVPPVDKVVRRAVDIGRWRARGGDDE